MTRLLGILLVALLFEAIGVVFLKEGLRELGDVPRITLPAVVGVVKAGATNRNILLGVLFEALFFAGLLVLMSKGDVSFIWPLTALGFVLATLAARIFLHERVTLLRWGGVLLIMLGAGLITYTEHKKPKPAALPSPDPPDRSP